MAAGGRGADNGAWLRRARVVSGLVLMAFALSHFLNHALGLHSVALMERSRELLAFWHLDGFWHLLLLAILVHMTTALLGLYRRRSLRLPAWQWLQLVSGLAIPFFMIQHYLGARWLPVVSGKMGGYPLELAIIWPDLAVRHGIGLLVVWLHGCVGLHYWLRLRAWYRRLQPALLALAVLVPTLALTGFVAAGREMATLVGEPAAFAAYAAANDWPVEPWHFAFVLDNEVRWMVGLAALLGLLLAARVLRGTLEQRRQSYRIDYGDGRRVRAPFGTSLLEASRLHGLPHAAVCGGRGRCSTCRVRVTDGLETLPAAEPSEARLLARLRAPPDVRLACQLRPVADLAVLRLMPAGTTARAALARLDPGHGVEREVAVLFADLRGFTTLSEGRLPFDVVHLLNRYFQAMGAAIEAEGGHVDKFIGDGIMALFGVAGGPGEAARAALRAVCGMDRALAELGREFAAELPQPLRMVIGLHHGPAIVGEMGYGPATGLTAIGDTVNVASRLEGIAKEHDVEVAISADLLAAAGLDGLAAPRRAVTIRGRASPLVVALVARAAELPSSDLAAPEPRPLIRRRWRLPARARDSA